MTWRIVIPVSVVALATPTDSVRPDNPVYPVLDRTVVGDISLVHGMTGDISNLLL